MNIFLWILLKFISSIKFNDSYVFNFLLMYVYYFQLTSNHLISLAISLINLFASTFIKYVYAQDYIKAQIINNIIFICLLYCHVEIIKLIEPYVNIIIFICTSYVLLSTCEWLTHKYIMHCDKKSLYYKILSKFDYYNLIEKTCDSHIQHHLEVKPNMHLSGVKNKDSLFMGWKIGFYIGIVNFFILCLTKNISQISLSYFNLFLLAIGLTVGWSYLWNKVHPLMHQYEGTYSIKEGPYESILNLNLISKLLYKNHQNHHLQKGHKKGNYNIIIFGADEWFGTNVQNVDNREYCANSQVFNEEICKSFVK